MATKQFNKSNSNITVGKVKVNSDGTRYFRFNVSSKKPSENPKAQEILRRGGRVQRSSGSSGGSSRRKKEPKQDTEALIKEAERKGVIPLISKKTGRVGNVQEIKQAKEKKEPVRRGGGFAPTLKRIETKPGTNEVNRIIKESAGQIKSVEAGMGRRIVEEPGRVTRVEKPREQAKRVLSEKGISASEELKRQRIETQKAKKRDAQLKKQLSIKEFRSQLTPQEVGLSRGFQEFQTAKKTQKEFETGIPLIDATTSNFRKGSAYVGGYLVGSFGRTAEKEYQAYLERQEFFGSFVGYDPNIDVQLQAKKIAKSGGEITGEVAPYFLGAPGFIGKGLVDVGRAQTPQEAAVTGGTLVLAAGAGKVASKGIQYLSKPKIIGKPVVIATKSKKGLGFVQRTRIKTGLRKTDIFTEGTLKKFKPTTKTTRQFSQLKITGPGGRKGIVKTGGAVDDFVGVSDDLARQGKVNADYYRVVGKQYTRKQGLSSLLPEKNIVSEKEFVKAYTKAIGKGKQVNVDRIIATGKAPSLKGKRVLEESTRSFRQIPKDIGVSREFGEPIRNEQLVRFLEKSGKKQVLSPTFTSKSESFLMNNSILSKVRTQAPRGKALPEQLVITRFSGGKASASKAQRFGFSVKSKTEKTVFSKLSKAKQAKMLSGKERTLLPELTSSRFDVPSITRKDVQQFLKVQGTFKPSVPRGGTGIVSSGSSNFGVVSGGGGTLLQVKTKTRSGSTSIAKSKVKQKPISSVREKSIFERKTFQKSREKARSVQEKVSVKGAEAFGFSKSGVKQKNFLGAFVGSKGGTKQKPKVGQKVKPISIVAPATIVTPRVAVVPKTRTGTATTPKTKIKTITKTITKTIPKINLFIPGTPKPLKTKITLKRKPFEIKSKTKTPKGTFHSYVRKNNNTKWVKVTSQPRPYKRAVNIGLSVADNTLARSVKTKRVSKKNNLRLDDPTIYSQKFRSRKTKSRIPGQEKIFVEKNKFALDTFGEKRGIKASKYIKRGFGRWAF